MCPATQKVISATDSWCPTSKDAMEVTDGWFAAPKEVIGITDGWCPASKEVMEVTNGQYLTPKEVIGVTDGWCPAPKEIMEVTDCVLLPALLSTSSFSLQVAQTATLCECQLSRLESVQTYSILSSLLLALVREFISFCSSYLRGQLSPGSTVFISSYF